MGNAAVIRLKHTKEVLPKKWLKVWDDMSDLMNMKSSFKGIRDALLHGDPPKIPYLGVYLSDFTFIEGGRPSWAIFNGPSLTRAFALRRW